jgi:hypothetical protein
VPEIKAYKTDLEPPLHFPGVTREQVEAHAAQPAQPSALPAPAPVPAPASAPTQSLRQPVYQIYVKHEPGACPALPEGFSYIDDDKSIGRRACPKQVHRVFAQPIGIEAARRRVKQLQEVVGVVRVWIEDRKGQPLSRDSWHKENGRWVRDN